MVRDRVWSKRGILRSLLEDPEAFIAYTYLLTGPHQNDIGLFEDPSRYMAADLDIRASEATRLVEALADVGAVFIDHEADMVFVPETFLGEIDIMSSPGNKRWKGAANLLAKQPTCRFTSVLADIIERRESPLDPEALTKPFGALGKPSEGLVSGVDGLQQTPTPTPNPKQTHNTPEPTSPPAPLPVKPPAKKTGKAQRLEDARRLLCIWNEVHGESLRSQVHVDSIAARLSEFTPEEFEMVIHWRKNSRGKVVAPLNEGNYGLDTIYKKSKFEKYLQDAVREQAKGKANGQEPHFVKLWDVPGRRWIQQPAPPGQTAEEYIRVRRCDASKYVAEEPNQGARA